MDTTENKNTKTTEYTARKLLLWSEIIPSAASSHACPEPVLARIMDIVFFYREDDTVNIFVCEREGWPIGFSSLVSFRFGLARCCCAYRCPCA